ncbi:MAG: hypothetical protein ACJAZ3_002011 [Sphingobacteriales bacterium]|jgi:hypothetical protein
MKRLLILPLIISSTLCFSQKEALLQNLYTSKVIVQGDSTAVFQKKGFVSLAGKVAKIKNVEDVIGGLEVISPDNKVLTISFLMDSALVVGPTYNNWHDVISANVGSEVEVEVEENNQTTGFKGKILKEGLTSSFFVLGTDYGAQIIQISQVLNVAIIGINQKPNKHWKKYPIVNLSFDKYRDNQQLDLVYRRTGISWEPIYQLRIIDETSGTINLQAKVNNKAEPLVNTDLYFKADVSNAYEPFQYGVRSVTLGLGNSIIPLSTSSFKFKKENVIKINAFTPSELVNSDSISQISNAQLIAGIINRTSSTWVPGSVEVKDEFGALMHSGTISYTPPTSRLELTFGEEKGVYAVNTERVVKIKGGKTNTAPRTPVELTIEGSITLFNTTGDRTEIELQKNLLGVPDENDDERYRIKGKSLNQKVKINSKSELIIRYKYKIETIAEELN